MSGPFLIQLTIGIERNKTIQKLIDVHATYLKVILGAVTTSRLTDSPKSSPGQILPRKLNIIPKGIVSIQRTTHTISNKGIITINKTSMFASP